VAREDANKRLEERQKEYDQTSVNAEVDENWIELISQWEAVVLVDKDVCGKVGEETLGRIQEFRRTLFNLIGVVDDVIKESEVSVSSK
jgi:flagellar biosynthesis component FlhA